MKKNDKPYVYIVKKAFFPASHFHDGALDEEEHMHTFEFEVKLYGQVNGEGYLVDFREVEKVLYEKIRRPLTYKNLNNVLLPTPPTTENLAVWIYNTLRSEYGKLLHSVKVFETPESWVIYDGK